MSAASVERRAEVGALGGERRRGRRLFRGEALGERARRFVVARRLVDVGGNHRVGLDADLRQQRQTAGRAGGENEARARRTRSRAISRRSAIVEAYLKR